jgi:acyl-homoserine-lactone acylase
MTGTVTRDASSNAGAAILQEFVSIASSRDMHLWTVPSDARHPLTTPNTLSTSPDVVAAMAAAITRITDRGHDLSETYGEMHRSGDRGSAGWPLGGGLGDLSGDANAVSSTLGDPILDPVTRGSSYIQAIAYRGTNGIEARTILTYSQYRTRRRPGRTTRPGSSRTSTGCGSRGRPTRSTTSSSTSSTSPVGEVPAQP